MSKYLKGIRTAAPATEVARVDFNELVAEVGATDIRFVHPKSGGEYMHLVIDEEHYITIKLGDKLEDVPVGDEKRAKWLINNTVIYTGENKDGVMWFTFGPVPQFPEAKLISIKGLLAKKAVGAAGGN